MTPHRMTGAAPTATVWRWSRFTPDAAAQARVALRCALSQLGYEGDAISDAVLAVSELVANAVEHAVGPYEMRLRRISSKVICEVEDRDPRIPKFSAPRVKVQSSVSDEDCGSELDDLYAVLLSERGRGLQIVNELTQGVWGFRSRNGAKVAWMALPASPRG